VAGLVIGRRISRRRKAEIAPPVDEEGVSTDA